MHWHMTFMRKQIVFLVMGMPCKSKHNSCNSDPHPYPDRNSSA